MEAADCVVESAVEYGVYELHYGHVSFLYDRNDEKRLRGVDEFAELRRDFLQESNPQVGRVKLGDT